MYSMLIAHFSQRSAPIFRILFVLILSFIFLTLSSSKVRADQIFSCEVNVSPSTVTQNTSTSFNFSTAGASYDGEGVKWVKITRPSGNFSLTNGSGSGWSVSQNSTDVTFTTASAANPFTINLSITAVSGTSDAGSADWTVQMSHTTDGSFPATCTGNLGTSISGGGSSTPILTPTPTSIPDTTAPTISNIMISSVSDSSVTVSWDTNESSNSHINYGTTTSYGSSKDDSSMTTSHSMTIGSLSVNTTYHGQIQSTDGAGNRATSSDFTFATAQSTTTVTVITIVTPTPTATPIPDRTRPRITLTSQLEKVFTVSPVIEGSATDNEAVHLIEYSYDDGVNWSTVPLTTVDQKKVEFSFTPLLPGEGDYLVKIRATDKNNNQTETTAQRLTLDRLPPLVGGSFLSIGPQLLQPDNDGNYLTIVGLNPKLTLSAIGGATTINLKVNGQPQPMIQNPQTRLWSTQLDLKEVGTYQLETSSIDGAKNEKQKTLHPVKVLPNGVVSNSAGPINGARVSVYYFDSQYGQFRLWNADQYGQENPQLTDLQGRYKLFLPSGTYYIHIQGQFGQSLKSNIFTINENTPIIQNFELQKKSGFSLGLFTFPFIEFGQNDVMMNLSGLTDSEKETAAVIDKPFPDFDLGGYQSTSLTGKPMIVSVLASWLPQTSAQMSIFNELNDKESGQVLVIMSQDSVANAAVFAQQGGYTVPIIADPDGVLLDPLHVTSMPTHFYLNRKGVVTKVVSGVLNKTEIEEALRGY